MKKLKLDLNADLGEGTGLTISDVDRGIIDVITSANIACGYHAGNKDIMEDAVKYCKETETNIGAHPGLDDKENFGRLPMDISPKEAYSLVFKQIRDLQEIAANQGIKLHHVKPHGALYNMAAKDFPLAQAIAKAVCDCSAYNGGCQLKLYGLAESKMAEAAAAEGVSFCAEVFADRAYNDDGSLVSRKEEGAVITDKEAVVERILKLVKKGKITTISGRDIFINADTVCVHGDTAGALELAKAIKSVLDDKNLDIF